MIQAAKIIGTGLATTGLIGASVGFGVVFDALIKEVSRNPSLRENLFGLSKLIFAFLEATGLFLLFWYLENYTVIQLSILCTMFILNCILNYKFNFFNIKTLLKNSIKLRIILWILGCIFMVFNLNIIYINMPLLLLIFISIILSKNKLESILRLSFLIVFWSSITISFVLFYYVFASYDPQSIIIGNLMLSFLAYYIADGMELPSNLNIDNYKINFDGKFEYIKFGVFDLIKLEDILFKFLLYYNTDGFELYSNLNSENSGEILNALHQLLQESNLKFLQPGGGGGWDPISASYVAKGLFLESDDEAKFFTESGWTNEKEFYSNELQVNAKKIDDYNKNLDYPKGNEMIKEKNELLSYNISLIYHFSTPYSIPNIAWHPDYLDFFYNFEFHIKTEIQAYNAKIGAKHYYESENKLLPNLFKDLWNRWHISQLYGNVEEMMDEGGSNILNYRREDLVYGELNDNILIEGLALLCKMHVYSKLLNEYAVEFDNVHKCEYGNIPIFDVDWHEFYSKAWKYYQEFQEEHYPFFHHYNWHCKLFSIETSSKVELLDLLKNTKEFHKMIESVPPLSEEVLSKGLRLDWFRPDYYTQTGGYKYPVYKWQSFPYVMGLGKTEYEWTNMQYFIQEYFEATPLEYPKYKLQSFPYMLGLGKTEYEWTNMKEFPKPLVLKPSLPKHLPITNEDWMEYKSYNLDILVSDNDQDWMESESYNLGLLFSENNTEDSLDWMESESYDLGLLFSENNTEDNQDWTGSESYNLDLLFGENNNDLIPELNQDLD